jgi:hypothetical protein
MCWIAALWIIAGMASEGLIRGVLSYGQLQRYAMGAGILPVHHDTTIASSRLVTCPRPAAIGARRIIYTPPKVIPAFP